jgi:hypothetical protein
MKDEEVNTYPEFEEVGIRCNPESYFSTSKDSKVL